MQDAALVGVSCCTYQWGVKYNPWSPVWVKVSWVRRLNSAQRFMGSYHSSNYFIFSCNNVPDMCACIYLICHRSNFLDNAVFCTGKGWARFNFFCWMTLLFFCWRPPHCPPLELAWILDTSLSFSISRWKWLFWGHKNPQCISTEACTPFCHLCIYGLCVLLKCHSWTKELA